MTGSDGKFYVNDKEIGKIDSWTMDTSDCEIEYMTTHTPLELSGKITGTFERGNKRKWKKLVSQFYPISDKPFNVIFSSDGEEIFEGHMKLSRWQRFKIRYFPLCRIKMRGYGELKQL